MPELSGGFSPKIAFALPHGSFPGTTHNPLQASVAGLFGSYHLGWKFVALPVGT